MNILRKSSVYLLLVSLAVVFYAFTIRGNVGVPTLDAIENELSIDGNEFETSQERSRYAMILSIYHDNTIHIDPYARIATPDMGKINGHYYSFFPPALSIFALPFYHIGLNLNMPQLIAFLVSTLATLLTMLLMVRLAKVLEFHWSIAVFVALAFGFATNAWGYSVTLYAHTLSALLVLSGIYLTINNNKKSSVLRQLAFWLIYGLATFVDYPNLFIFLPMAFLNFFKAFEIRKQRSETEFSINWLISSVPFVFVACLIAYGIYNNVLFGSPTQLSNTIPRVTDFYAPEELKNAEAIKDSFDALKTRNLMNGLYTFTISIDRGILVYSPIVLLAMLTVFAKKKSYKYAQITIFSVSLMCLILYSMFTDPWGGWAFGSRYMIAIMPGLLILLGMGMQKLKDSVWAKLLISIVYTYSVAISLLAPLTTNVIPPVVEARPLNIPYFFIKNIRMIQKNELNSYLFNNHLSSSLSGIEYYFIVLAMVTFTGLILIWIPKHKASHE